MNIERRQKPRTKIHGVYYIEIGADNAVVLDISEGGLSFQGAGPLLTSGAVRFGFLSHLKGRVDGEGEIAWKSVDNKVGGLRFTHMPPAAWGCVNELLGDVGANKAQAEPAAAFDGVAAANPIPRRRSNVRSNVFAASQRQPSPPSIPAEPEAEVSFLLPSAGSLDDEWKTARNQGFFRGIAIGVVVTALAAAGLWALYVNVGDIHNPFAAGRAEGTLSSQAQPQTAPPNAQAPAQSAGAAIPGQTSDAGGDAPSGGNLTQPSPAGLSGPDGPATSGSKADAADPSEVPPLPADLSSKLKLGSPGDAPNAQTAQSEALPPHAPGPPLNRDASVPSKASARVTELGRSDALPSVEDGQQELAAADKILRSGNRPNFATAAQWLWAAVKDGNTQAEVELSDLYLSGEGVARNCEQARVLLLAAAAKGNAEARERLQTVSPSGCRS